MRRRLAALTLITATFFAASSAASTSVIPGHSFYIDKERGWFWYEEPEPEPEVVEPLEPEVVVDSSNEEVEPDVLETPATVPGPPPGSVAWIRESLPKLRDRAIEDPTDENVQAYYYTQRVMMDMSERFARRANEVIGGDPFLDEDLRSPASNAASNDIAQQAAKTRDSLLSRLSEEVAVLFFFEGKNCRMCASTIASLTTLSHQYGFTIMPISVDGFPLAGNPFGEVQYDTGLSEHLGVITTPAIGIAVPPKGAEIVSYSSVSMETAATRILSAAYRQNLITKTELDQTERMNNIGLIDNTRLMSESEDITDSPTEFINLIREEARRAFTGSRGQ